MKRGEADVVCARVAGMGVDHGCNDIMEITHKRNDPRNPLRGEGCPLGRAYRAKRSRPEVSNGYLLDETRKSARWNF